MRPRKHEEPQIQVWEPLKMRESLSLDVLCDTHFTKEVENVYERQGYK